MRGLRVAAIIPSDNNKIRFVAGLLMLTATYVIGDMYSASLTSILARPPKGNRFPANYYYFDVGKIISSHCLVNVKRRVNSCSAFVVPSFVTLTKNNIVFESLPTEPPINTLDELSKAMRDSGLQLLVEVQSASQAMLEVSL